MSTMSKRRARQATAGRVEKQAKHSLDQLQAALRDLIEAIPGLTRRPADLSRTLGVHTKLGWQVHRVANADDPLAEASHVPKPAAMGRFLDAAAKRGAPSERIDAVRAAQSAFEQMIEAHAGSRGEFDSIVSGLTVSRSESVDLAHKRAAFKAQSHFLGIQAKTHLGMVIFQPSAREPTKHDAAFVRGLIGLRRFRDDVSWILASLSMQNDDGSPCTLPAFEPIAPANEAMNVGLLSEFCSKPLPAIRLVRTDSGTTHVVVEPRGVGSESILTCLVGNVLRGAAPRYRDQHNQYENNLLKIRTPCEVLIHDTLIYRGIYGPTLPRVFVRSDHRTDAVGISREADLLPMRESIIYLGSAMSALATPDVPRYEELANSVFNRLGWDRSMFDVYRCRLEYPVMPSSVVVQFDLPEKPEKRTNAE